MKQKSSKSRSKSSKSSKSKSSSTSDFKRIKAKVGRKVSKNAINGTETGFHAVRLNVGVQHALQNDKNTNISVHVDQLVSSRGQYSLAELTAKFSHPASTVRISAAKGLADVLRQSSSSLAEEAHLVLPALMFPLSKTLIDEHESVRSTGVSLLEALLQHLQQVQPEQQQEDTIETRLQPFADVLMAHVNLALNSLDRSVRSDGARAVTLLCRSIPNLLAPYVPVMLPALTRLLSEVYQTTTMHTQTATKTINGTHHPRDRDAIRILQSLLSLLRTATATTNRATIEAKASAPFQYHHQHQHPTAALILAEYQRKHPDATTRSCLVNIRSLADIASIRRMSHKSHGSTNSDTVPITTLSAASALLLPTFGDLLERLRDALLETTTTTATSTASSPNLEMIVLIAHIVQAILDLLLRIIASKYDDDLSPSHPSSSLPVSFSKRFRNACKQIRSCLLEVVMVQSDGLQNDTLEESNTAAVAINLQLVLAILSLMEIERTTAALATTSSLSSSSSSSSNDENNSKQIMMTVIACVNQSLSLHNVKNTSSVNIEESAANYLIPQALNKLWSMHGNGTARDSETLQWFQVFVKSFFHRENVADDESESSPKASIPQCRSRMRSSVARQAVQLATRLLLFSFDSSSSSCGRADSSIPSSSFLMTDSVVTTMLESIPRYMMAWRSDYPHDIRAVLELLHTFMRRGRDQNPSQLVTTTLWIRLDRLLLPLIESTLSKSSSKDAESIFEQYTDEESQRIMIYLLIQARQPQQIDPSILTAFRRMCSRSLKQGQEGEPGGSANVISPCIRDLVIQAVHEIRKTLPMNMYLSFLLEIIVYGIVDCRGAAAESEGSALLRLLEYDQFLKLICRLLIECGPASKILPMLYPFLTACLQKSIDNSPACDLLHVRSALGIVAFLSLHHNAQPPSSSPCIPFSVMPPCFHEMLVQSIARFCQHLFVVWEASDPSIQTLMHPIIALTSIPEANLLAPLFQSILLRAASSPNHAQDELQQLERRNQLHAFFVFITSPRLEGTMRASYHELMECFAAHSCSSSTTTTTTVSARSVDETSSGLSCSNVNKIDGDDLDLTNPISSSSSSNTTNKTSTSSTEQLLLHRIWSTIESYRPPPVERQEL